MSNESKEDKEMSNVVIRKVNVLRGRAKDEAERQGLDPNDLVIVTTSVHPLHPLPEYHIEKIEGDPVSYLLSCENGDITAEDIREFGRMFLDNVNKELGIEDEVRETKFRENPQSSVSNPSDDK